MARQMTPLLRPLRNDSGTVYVFPSANEDIGLNLNDRDNRVALSYYALLNLPKTDTSTLDAGDVNYFNFTNIPSVANIMNSTDTQSLSIPDKIACALQNYMMNMETVIANQSDYDYSASKTVSERVFWKFLKETGAIRWRRAGVNVGDGNVYEELPDTSAGYQRVVKCVGQISAGNSISDEFGMFNETYVNVPSSYGSVPQYFKVVEDNNYQLGHVYTQENGDYLSGRDSTTSKDGFTQNVPCYDYVNVRGNQQGWRYAVENDSSLPWYQVIDSENELTNGTSSTSFYLTEEEPGENEPMDYNMSLKVRDDYVETRRKFKRSRLDGVELISDITELQQIYEALDPDRVGLAFDFDSINTDASIAQNFEFNSILLYYSVYDKMTGDELATNLFGLVFLNGPQIESMSYNTGDVLNFGIPTYIKKKSSGSGTNKSFGTGFSFKLNIKTLSVYDNTDALIRDNTTTRSLYADDFGEVLYSLNKSVNLIGKNNEIAQTIQRDYQEIVTQYQDIQYKIGELNKKINQLFLKKFSDIDASNVHSRDIQCENLDVSGHISLRGTWDIERMDASKFTADEATITSLDASTISSGSVVAEYISTPSKLDASSLYTMIGAADNMYINYSLYQNVDIQSANRTQLTKNTSVDDIISFTRIDYANIVENGDVHQEYIIAPETFVKNAGQGSPYALMPYAYDHNIRAISYLKYIPVIIKFLKDHFDKTNDLDVV